MNASSSLSRLDALLAGAAALALAGLAFAAASLPLAASIACLLAAAGAVGALLQTARLKRDLKRAAETLKALQHGDFNARIIGLTDGGPMGTVLREINNFADRTDAFVRESKASLEAFSHQRYHRQIIETGMLGDFGLAARTINRASASMSGKIEAFRSVTGTFENRLTSVVGAVSSASTDMKTTADSLSHHSARSRAEAVAVASASNQASTNVQTVASAAEELSSSIGEIASQVSRSASLSGSAATQVRDAEAQVGTLTDAAQRIGEVVTLIRDIAAQTNLLALNATIEAARAGEAGKGFAVVAGEVKNLANQTARATEDIVGQVTAIQQATDGAVTAIQSVSEAVGQVDVAMQAIASAVEQQAAATQEIARNVEEASAGTQEVRSRIEGVSTAADDTGKEAQEVQRAAVKLSDQSDLLGAELSGFLQELRKVV